MKNKNKRIKNFHYFVEGECEKKLINTLKWEYVESGKITVLNVAHDVIPKAKFRTLDKDTLCVLIVDIDKILQDENCRKKVLENRKNLENNKINYIFIYQNENLEDEIVKSTNINKIENFYNVNSKKEHKNLFIKDKKLLERLEKFEFNVDKIWNYNNEKIPKSNSSMIKIHSQR